MTATPAPPRTDVLTDAALGWAREVSDFDGDQLPKGQRCSTISCPLAVATGLSVGVAAAWTEGAKRLYVLPPPVTLWLSRFDAGFYPEFDMEAGES